MMTDARNVFIDTNILVYATNISAPFHADAAQALKTMRSEGANLWISQQVIREYIATVTRPQTYSQAVPVEFVIEQINRLVTEFAVADGTGEVLRKLLVLLRDVPTAGKQIHDANIVATIGGSTVWRDSAATSDVPSATAPAPTYSATQHMRSSTVANPTS